MRNPVAVLLAASFAAALGCSDRSPTSPMAATGEMSEAGGRPVTAVGRSHNTAVLAPRSDGALPPGVWGSAEASLSVGPAGARLEILSATFPMGACFGKYGDVIQGVPRGRFSLSGTFTQLIGAYPGKIQYPAQYSGLVQGDTISVTVTVPDLGQSFGPFLLVRGVTNSWTPCMYP